MSSLTLPVVAPATPSDMAVEPAQAGCVPLWRPDSRTKKSRCCYLRMRLQCSVLQEASGSRTAHRYLLPLSPVEGPTAVCDLSLALW